MTEKSAAFEPVNREAIKETDVSRLIEELDNLTRIVKNREAAISQLAEQKNLLERLIGIKVATYTSLLQKIIEELNGSLKDIIFNSKQLLQQVGIATQPDLLNNLDKVLGSAEDLKGFLVEIEPLAHLTVVETTTDGFTLSYLLGVLKRIIPEYFQKDLTIRMENDCSITGDFDLLINIYRQLLMHAIGNVRKLRQRTIALGVSSQKGAPVFYIRHKGEGLNNDQIMSEFPYLKKLIDALGGTMWVRAKGGQGGISYSFSFGEKYIVKRSRKD
jgi:hypothetical protein